VHNRSNVGYAFINFSQPEDAERFRRIFSEHRFQRFQSRKISSVCTAHVQGLDLNLRHFENRAVTHARNDQYRPIVLMGNQRVDFEEAVAGAKARLAGVSAPQLRNSNASRAPRGVNLGADLAAANAAVNAPAAVTAGPRLGLENAIRDLLHSRASPAVGPSEAPTKVFDDRMLPPGLHQAPACAAPGANRDAVGNDITQLLSLRSMLVDRLLEKETIQHTAFDEATWNDQAATIERGGPAYVGSSSDPAKVNISYNRMRTISEEWEKAAKGSTPRANSVYLGNMLDKLVPDSSWCVA